MCDFFSLQTAIQDEFTKEKKTIIKQQALNFFPDGMGSFQDWISNCARVI